eukprot:g17529.t1
MEFLFELVDELGMDDCALGLIFFLCFAFIEETILKLDSSAANVRPVDLLQGLLGRADGSVQYKQGLTQVLVAVFGPMPVSSRQEKSDRAAVEVVFKFPSGAKTDASTELSEIVRGAMEAIVWTNMYPRTKISLVVQVVRDDGALLAASLNAACLALVDAGVDCKSMLTAVCVGRDSDTSRPSGVQQAVGQGGVLLDPTKADEERVQCTATLAFNSTHKELLVSDTRGRWQVESYLESVNVGQRAAEKLHAPQISVLVSTWLRELCEILAGVRLPATTCSDVEGKILGLSYRSGSNDTFLMETGTNAETALFASSMQPITVAEGNPIG